VLKDSHAKEIGRSISINMIITSYIDSIRIQDKLQIDLAIDRCKQNGNLFSLIFKFNNLNSIFLTLQ